MTSFFQLLVFSAFGFCSALDISMIRNFSYPTIDDFVVYWNVPSYLCHSHGIHIEHETTKHGIITNTNDKFRGENIVILYDPGLFPSVFKDQNKKTVVKNGGIPQSGNLTLHLEQFRESIRKGVPKDFRGVGVIDFEVWRPVFRQNWNDQTLYTNMSKELVRQKHTQWSELKIRDTAKNNFEKAAKNFMENTLKEVKILRPNATWGYYGFPYCYNFKKNGGPECPKMVEQENEDIQWLWDESTALHPSLYISASLTTEIHRKLILGRLNEAWRIATKGSSKPFTKVYPYVWFRFYDEDKYLPKDHIETALETIKGYKMGGAIIWGGSNDVSNQKKCKELYDHVRNVIGPVVLKLKSPQPNGSS